jgi:hypothetical protein
MEQLRGLPLGRQIVLGAGVLLLIDTFLPWQKWTVGPFSVSHNAWSTFWGVLLALVTIALLVWVGARSFDVKLPVDVPDGVTTLAAGVLTLILALIKNLADDHSAWASYVGVLLAAAVAYGAWLVFQGSGESLPSMSTATSGGSSQAPPPEPPPSEPQQPADV